MSHNKYNSARFTHFDEVTVFRFSIREALLAILVLALGLAWWHDHRRLQHEAEMSDRFKQCAEHLARMLDQYGWRWTVSPNGLIHGESDAAVPKYLYEQRVTDSDGPRSSE